MPFAGDELTALVGGASRTARGSASAGTGVRQKRILNATVTAAASGGLVSVQIDGAATASPASVSTGFSAAVGDRVLVTLIGRGLQVVTGQSGAGSSNGVASVSPGFGLNTTGPASNPTIGSLVLLGRVAAVSGSLPSSLVGEDGKTYTLATGGLPVGGSNATTTGVPANTTYNVGDACLIRAVSTGSAVVVSKMN